MKILIIKTGMTETFDTSINHSEIVSLGDIVRSTVILNLFLNDEVIWLTHPQAILLLDSLKEISHVITSTDELKDELNLESFDCIINLERNDKIFAKLHTINLEKISGYTNNNTLLIKNKSYDLNTWLFQDQIKNLNWSEKLFFLLSQKWTSENYFLPSSNINPLTKNQFDIGFNWQVGSKWPTKKWSFEKWIELENKLSSDFSISWQEGFNDLITYINWVNSCKIIVTHDSLGLHIANALQKKVIVLFGPTSSEETPLSKQSCALSAKSEKGFDCLPCYKEICHNEINCMDFISVNNVIKHLHILVKQ